MSFAWRSVAVKQGLKLLQQPKIAKYAGRLSPELHDVSVWLKGRYERDEIVRSSGHDCGEHSNGSVGGDGGSGCWHEEEDHETTGGDQRKNEDTDIPASDVVFTASLPNAFYSIGDNGAIKGTDKLIKLHLQFARILDAFPRHVPLRCSFLSDKNKPGVESSADQEERSKGRTRDITGSSIVDFGVGQGKWRAVGGMSESSFKEAVGNSCGQRLSVDYCGCQGEQTGDVSRSNFVATHKKHEVEIESAEIVVADTLEKEEENREVESRNSHLPVNHPTRFQTPVFPLGNQYYKFGKGSDVDVESCPEDWFTYRLVVIPSTNFKVSDVSSVVLSDGKKYVFHGFTVVSKHSLDELPECKLDKYGGKYVIKLAKNSAHKNFTLKDALIFEEYLFVKLLEMYDWAEYLNPFRRELYFVPRFCRKVDDTWEVLSMAEVLQYLIKSYQPLQQSGLVGKDRAWKEGDLLIQHDKVPSCFRIDGISESIDHQVKIKHHCSQLHRNHASTKALCSHCYSYYLQQKNIQWLLSLKEQINTNSLSSEHGLYTTGLSCDIPQHVLLLCMISHHILFHDSIKTLQQRLGYHFHNPTLLHHALTHTPSYSVVAEDHLCNVLWNCGLKRPEFVKSTGKATRCVKELKKAVMVDKTDVDETQRPQNNGQLEYLGDAVIEYICSKRLFLKHPEYSVRTLSKEKRLLVNNENLSILADRFNLGEFVQKISKTVYTVKSFAHIQSDCLESVLGAMFLDGGLDEVDRVFARLAFPKKEEHDSWFRNENHPLQSKYPDGDRHLLDEGSGILKRMVDFEEQRGIKFKHLTLLTNAFVHDSCIDTSLTDGNYQRLAFLGHAILQILVSKFVYHKFPAHHEGHLQLLCESLRSKQLAASICEDLSMDKFIITGNTEEVELSIRVKADVVEAFLAALTFDQGLDAAERFLEKHLFPRLKDVVCKSELENVSVRLNQAAVYTCRQQGVKTGFPEFRLVKSEKVSDDAPTVTMAVFLGEKELGVGSASSTREAKRKAAETALQSGLLQIPPCQSEENWTDFASKL